VLNVREGILQGKQNHYYDYILNSLLDKSLQTKGKHHYEQKVSL